MADTAIENPKLLEMLEPILLNGEQVQGVWNVKGFASGFVAITDKRLLYWDPQLMKGRRTFTSVPYGKITAVGVTEQGGKLFGKSELVIEIGSRTLDFEFQGGDKAQQAYRLIMERVL